MLYGSNMLSIFTNGNVLSNMLYIFTVSTIRRVKVLVVYSLRRRDRPKLDQEDRVKHNMKELLLSDDITSNRNELRVKIRLDAKGDQDLSRRGPTIGISQPLQMLHVDLFGPTSVRSFNHKTYCLVVTDDFSKFSWVFFLATKDETSGILKTFITSIENHINHKVKIIKCDNGTEFKNNDMNQLCGLKGIKKEFSVARTPQQNGVAERKNRTLIEAVRTMLADSLLPTTFWAEAVNTDCYVQNRVLVTKPHNKTPYASFMGFIVYQMDLKSAFLYGIIEEEVYVCQPPGFEDSHFPNKVYKKSLCDEFEQLMHKRFQMSSMEELTFFLGLQVKQKDDGILISQDKYMADILKKFDFATVKTANTPIETNKALLKDEEADDVDIHLYRLMIGSLMYLTASRPDIMFDVCAYARFQVTPKVSHLHAVKRIFRYLKGQPKLGLLYPRDSPFDLEAFSNSDYARAGLDRKSITGAEYVAAANYYGQMLWIQNQMLDYGFNFMNTKIYIDNESTICIVKNLVFYSKTKHIEIRHHFIRDSNVKRLIQVIKIHTDHNVVDLLTKAFDVSRDADFHEIVDFLTTSSIHYALTTLVTSESSVRSDLHFNDEDGITCLTNESIFENLALMGYESDSNKLTFQKALFSPQWKYLIHIILHCLSSKSTSWNEFSTNIASIVICLATGQKFNFSKLIFDGMLRNLDTTKFLMYPRFLQLFMNNQIQNLAKPFNDTYETPKHTKKVFTNIRRKGKGFSGRITPLFASMLAPPVVEGEGSGHPSEPQPPPSTAQPTIEEQIPVTESSSPQNTQTPRQAL
ncbi:putative ribonuclease H-like domain-containing protein [Tanacetum coccineum]